MTETQTTQYKCPAKYTARMTIEEQLLPENQEQYEYLGKFTRSELLILGYTADYYIYLMDVFNDLHKSILQIFRDNNIELKFITYRENAPGFPTYDFRSDDVMIIWRMDQELDIWLDSNALKLIVKLDCGKYGESKQFVLTMESIDDDYGVDEIQIFNDQVLGEIRKLAEKVNESNITLK